MKERSWVIASSILVVVATLTTPAHSSHEKNVEVATGIACEELLATAKAKFGVLVEIEHAIAFAFEERRPFLGTTPSSSLDPEFSEQRRTLTNKITRLVAMHRLFQNPQCPIDKDWYRYEPKIFKVEDWWFTNIQRTIQLNYLS